MRNILARLAGVMAVVMAALVITAAPSAAAPINSQSCRNGQYLYPGTSFNICIFIGNYGNGDWEVTVGLDVNVSMQHAQEWIINCPANFSAELWGSDVSRAAGLQTSPPPAEDDFRTYLPIAVNPYVWSGGLGVGFGKRFDWSVLNEDVGTDEIYVLVKFTDCALGIKQVMIRTDDIIHNF
jgi:hypothetical protein